MALYVPKQLGVAALDELDAVPWKDLEFAYMGEDSDSLNHDVKASLLALEGTRGDWEDGTYALFSNIFHQGTVYEATAAAVPFLAAVAAGPAIEEGLRLQLVVMLTEIALSSSMDARGGGSSGAFGEDVAEKIRAALIASAPLYDHIAAASPVTAPAFPAMLLIAKEPRAKHFEPLRAINEMLDAIEPPGADAPAPAVGPDVRYRHPKLGDATLVRRQDASLVLRFDDGKERVIRESFVTKLE